MNQNTKEKRWIFNVLVIAGIFVGVFTAVEMRSSFHGEEYLSNKVLKLYDEGKYQEAVDAYEKIEWKGPKDHSRHFANIIIPVAVSYSEIGQAEKGRALLDLEIDDFNHYFGAPISNLNPELDFWLSERMLLGDMPELVEMNSRVAGGHYSSFYRDNRISKQERDSILNYLLDKEDWVAVGALTFSEDGFRIWLFLHHIDALYSLYNEASFNSYFDQRNFVFKDLIKEPTEPLYALEKGDAWLLVQKGDIPLATRLDSAEWNYKYAAAVNPSLADEVALRMKYVDKIKADIALDPASVAEISDGFSRNFSYHAGRQRSDYDNPIVNSVGIAFARDYKRYPENSMPAYIGKVTSKEYQGNIIAINDSALMFDIRPGKAYDVREVDGKSIVWYSERYE